MHAVVIWTIVTLAGICVCLAFALFGGRALRQRSEAVAAAEFARIRMDVYSLLEDPTDAAARAALCGVSNRRWRRSEPRLLALVENLRGDSVGAFTEALQQRDLAGETRRDLRSRRVRRRLRGAHRAGVLHLSSCRHEIEEAATDRDRAVSAAAVRALGRIGDPRSAATIFHAVRGGHDGLAVDALTRLARSASEAVATALRSSDPRVRRVAALVIGEAQLVALGRDLEPVAVDDPSPVVREAAVRSLGSLGNPLHFAAVARAAGDPVITVRRTALVALGRLGDARAVPLLIRGLSDHADLADIAAESALSVGPEGEAALRTIVQPSGRGPVAAALEVARLRRDH